VVLGSLAKADNVKALSGELSVWPIIITCCEQVDSINIKQSVLKSFRQKNENPQACFMSAGPRGLINPEPISVSIPLDSTYP
jgi:hypothetical protein